VLGPVEVAVRDGGQARGGDPREDLVAVHELEPVDRTAQLAPFGREPRGTAVARAGRVGLIRMGGNERRPVAARGGQSVVDSVCDSDELSQPDGDGMGGPQRILVVVGQLEPGQEEQPVERVGAHRLALDLREIARPHLLVDVAPVARRVIRDREHVEARAPVEVDEIGDGERAVAPRRMRVKLAEQRRRLDEHVLRVSPCPAGFGRQRGYRAAAELL
jgi:hypothetical protein